MNIGDEGYDAVCDVNAAMEILWDLPGGCVSERARAAQQRIEYLERQVWIAENNERAAFACLEQDRAELQRLRRFVNTKYQRQGEGHEQVARQTSWASSP
jgi:hypothetical protein